jgi:hypothetical protein
MIRNKKSIAAINFFWRSLIYFASGSVMKPILRTPASRA